ncbi:MAG: arginine repressor [Oscillibacter sp.]|nr:arginine repressor [Oscillibacter sp.]
MKSERQALILEIIEKQNVETQEQLLDLLRKRGVETTQATVSRDIKKLHLVKQPFGGSYRYAAAERSRLNAEDKLLTIFRESLVSIDCAQNMVVVKTLSGLAGGACEALDHMEIAGLLGTLAGENTIFMVMRDTDSAQVFCEEIRETL